MNMNGTILFSPSNQDLQKLAEEHPEIYENVKQKMLNEIQNKCSDYISNRLASRSSSIYERLASETESKIFKKNGYSSPVAFEDRIQQKLTANLEAKLLENIEAEFNEYLNSEDFKKDIRSELRRRAQAEVIKALDAEIVSQANKFIKM